MPWIVTLDTLNPFTTYLFDKAVTAFGTVISNALQETVEVGPENSRRTVAKYKLGDLLEDGWQFPNEGGFGVLKGLDIYEEAG